MKKKRIIIICIFSILIFAGSLAGTKIYENNYDKKIKSEKETIKKIKSVYDDFLEADNDAIDQRNSIYKKYSSFYEYYDGIKSNYDNLYKAFSKYEEQVEKVKTDAEYLLNKCVGYDYMSDDVTTKCYAFQKNYEQTINSFVEDIKLFNTKVSDYNAWVKEEKLGYKSLKEYTTKSIKDYIDVDKNGVYLGKNSD